MKPKLNNSSQKMFYCIGPQSLAVITFHAKCYHWETRTRTVTERDSKGNYLRTRYETYQEMVVTHTDFETYNYGRQVDASGDAITDTKGASKTVTRVKLSKTWVLGDELTKRDFHAKNEAFQDRNRGLKLVQGYQQLVAFWYTKLR